MSVAGENRLPFEGIFVLNSPKSTIEAHESFFLKVIKAVFRNRIFRLRKVRGPHRVLNPNPTEILQKQPCKY